MEVRHFDQNLLKRDEVDGDDLDYGRHNRSFADWHKNSEVALLMVTQKFFTEMNTLGRIKSWQAMWQLTQLFQGWSSGRTTLSSLHGFAVFEW